MSRQPRFAASRYARLCVFRAALRPQAVRAGFAAWRTLSLDTHAAWTLRVRETLHTFAAVTNLVRWTRPSALRRACVCRLVASAAFPAVFVSFAAHADRRLNPVVWRDTERFFRRRLARDGPVGTDDVIEAAVFAVGPTMTVVGTRNTIAAPAKRSGPTVRIISTLNTNLTV